MGDLAIDTAVRALGDGLYEATMSKDWEIWGPMGGYVAACALRAAGASTPELRPAAFSCHYLSVAQFEPVDIRVSTRKRGRTAVAQRVEIAQGHRSILDAMVWSVGEVDGLEHDETIAPAVAGPEQLASVEDLLPDDAQPPFPFWNNLDE
ncbi:MAG: acyl-CoA thioesterase, partial [Actinomycetota bacterium]|nr:acyl-CoA thioesterase [Actinomycetota bacterium]